MAQLLVRNLEEQVVRALKRRAADNGRSAEAEHRAILRDVLAPQPEERPLTFKEYLLTMPDLGDDEDFDIPRDLPRDVEL